MVTYGQDETARLAQDMPHKDLTMTQDETFTGGLCLITMDPESNFIILEQLAQARDQTAWNACMAPALVAWQSSIDRLIRIAFPSRNAWWFEEKEIPHGQISCHPHR